MNRLTLIAGATVLLGAVIYLTRNDVKAFREMYSNNR
jgi:hypothetical protein